jgi:hypothetical protein
MKSVLGSRIVASFCLLACLSAVPETFAAADAAQSTAASETLAGKYVGTWQSGPDGGQLRITLMKDAAAWTAESSFTVGESQITGKVVRVAVDGSKLTMVIAWELNGTPGESRLTGEMVEGKKFDGTFESTTPDGNSSGTWTVTRA